MLCPWGRALSFHGSWYCVLAPYFATLWNHWWDTCLVKPEHRWHFYCTPQTCILMAKDCPGSYHFAKQWLINEQSMPLMKYEPKILGWCGLWNSGINTSTSRHRDSLFGEHNYVGLWRRYRQSHVLQKIQVLVLRACSWFAEGAKRAMSSAYIKTGTTLPLYRPGPWPAGTA